MRSLLLPPLPATTAAAAAWEELTSLPVTQLFARSRTTETAVVVLPGAGRVVRKRWSWPRARDRVKGALRTTLAARSPARREFDALLRLRSLPGDPFAPEPLGWMEERRGATLSACVLFLGEIEGAADLATFLAQESDADSGTVLESLARRVREMHDCGLVDREMHARNVLVSPRGEVFKVDCAKQQVRRGGASRAERVRDLADLDVALVRFASARRHDFLRVYLGDDAREDELEIMDRAIVRRRAKIEERESRRLPARRL